MFVFKFIFVKIKFKSIKNLLLFDCQLNLFNFKLLPLSVLKNIT